MQNQKQGPSLSGLRNFEEPAIIPRQIPCEGFFPDILHLFQRGRAAVLPSGDGWLSDIRYSGELFLADFEDHETDKANRIRSKSGLAFQQHRFPMISIRDLVSVQQSDRSIQQSSELIADNLPDGFLDIAGHDLYPRLDGHRPFHGIDDGKELSMSERNAFPLGIRQKQARVFERNDSTGSTFFARRHPSIDARNMLAADFGALLRADLGNDGLCGFEVFFAHVAIFAIIAITSQDKIAKCAIDIAAMPSIIAPHDKGGR